MKRPMIFINGLNQSQIDYLKSLSEYQHIENSSKISKDTQIYTYSDGTLDVVNSPRVDPKEEIVCTTYDEFINLYQCLKLEQLL